MSFVEPAFVGFLLLVLALNAAMPTARAQNAAIVVASLVFYGWVHPWFAGLLVASSTVDFLAALAMERQPGHRRKLLGLSLAANLGLLAWFKYVDFAVENVSLALSALGVDAGLAPLGLLLPAGISFYTFQTLSYTVDVYRGRVRARRSYVDYLAYVTFFPQLVAGPIERAGRLLPQLEARRSTSADALRSGLTLALWGAFTKVVVADTLAPYVDTVFLLRDPPGIVLWAGAAAFGVQLYADFQGYTNLARGAARMLGVELVGNFREPFLATSTPDFWRRWHTSLSSWVRDYVLGPLLGPAPTPLWRQVVAIVVAFVVMGAWHGAGWNFVAFGLWHAAWVLLYLGAGPWFSGRFGAVPGARWAAIAFHTLAVLLPGSVLFRTPDLALGLAHLTRAPWAGDADARLVAAHLLTLTAILGSPLALDWALRKLVARLPERAVPWLLPLETSAWAVLLLALVLFRRTTARDFIYFQF